TSPMIAAQSTGSFGGNSDSGNFVYQTLSSGGSVVSQVTSNGGEAGLMVRDGLGDDALYAGLFETPAGLSFEYRGTPGQAAVTSVNPGVPAPTWLKLGRDGNFISAYSTSTGADGTWTVG